MFATFLQVGVLMEESYFSLGKNDNNSEEPGDVLREDFWMFNVFSLPAMIYHYIGMTKMTRGRIQTQILL